MVREPFVILALVAAFGVRGLSQASIGAWTQPYPGDSTYWEHVESDGGPLLKIGAFAWVRKQTPTGESFATIAFFSPLYGQDGNRVLDGLVPKHVINTIVVLSFSGMDDSGMSLELRQANGATPWLEYETCLKDGLFRSAFITNARWQMVEACRRFLDWKEPRVLRFQRDTVYEVKTDFLVPITLQMHAANNQLRASVLR